MSFGNLIGQMLDTGYSRAADATLRAVASATNTPLIQQRLNELNAEAARLAQTGDKLKPDNAVLRALIADLEPTLKRAGSLIDGNAGTLTQASSQFAQTATRAMAAPGMSDADLAAIGVQWNVPDPVSVARLVDYADKPAWATEIEKYPGLTMDTLMNQAVRGMVEGWGPQRVASQITSMSETLPLAQARVLTRTLYLESYRSATAANQLANEDILTEQIRIGTLDDRICMCCLALHGTVLAVGEKVIDHHAGRCTSIAVVKGRPRTVQTGEEWFNALGDTPEGRARQLQIAGPTALDALKSGKANLKDFVQRYDDPVFGQMVREASLKSMGITDRVYTPRSSSGSSSSGRDVGPAQYKTVDEGTPNPGVAIPERSTPTRPTRPADRLFD